LPIENVESVKRDDCPGVLTLPLKAAVARVQNHSIRADRPTVTLVVSKTNCADGIPLRQRVLPFPTAIRTLGKGNRRSAKRNDDYGEAEKERLALSEQF
jgi:hypothetical protein